MKQPALITLILGLLLTVGGAMEAAANTLTIEGGSTLDSGATSTPAPDNLLSDGSDGLFAPVAALSLDPAVQNIFNFTSIAIGPDINVTIDWGAFADPVYLLATDEIRIDGGFDAAGGMLYLSSLGDIIINGTIYADPLTLVAGQILLGDQAQFFIGDNQGGATAGDIDLTAPTSQLSLAAVPEPGTMLLVAQGLGLIGFMKRRKLLQR